MLKFNLLICCIALVSASRLIRRELEVMEVRETEVIYDQTTMTCFSGDQKISQPCNGGTGTGCTYDACMQYCFDESECNFFFHITSTSGCILYRSCDNTRIAAYTGTTVEITRTEKPSTAPTVRPSFSTPTGLPTQAPTWREGLNVIYHQIMLTCDNGDQKVSQPCNGGTGTGCTFDACLEHCFDEDECNFLFHITETSGCILYRSCDETRTPAYSGTTVEVTLRPSHAPTSVYPTFSPSISPSTSPSKSPSIQPSGSPSASPSTAPTDQPSMTPSAQPSRSPSFSEPTQAPTKADGSNVIYYQTSLTCVNGDQKISQPCNGGTGTGCTYDVCMQHCFDESECNFFFHITSTSGCILYRSCDESRNPAYTGTTVEITREGHGLNVVYYETKLTCSNDNQKISQPCDGGQGTGCTYDACMQHCFDENECNFFFYITSRSGCILYRSCDETRTPTYSGTTLAITRY